MRRKLKLVTKISYDITVCECGEVISKGKKNLTNTCSNCGNVYTSDGVLMFKSLIKPELNSAEEDTVLHGWG